jgi:hypothetical protein
MRPAPVTFAWKKPLPTRVYARRYSATEERDDLPSLPCQIPVTSPSEMTIRQVRHFGRRPLLQVLVLIATNRKVLAYAREVCEVFLARGVDVCLQTTIDGSEVDLKEHSKVEVMTEHLGDIISNTKADFLIVVGDRNQARQTIQAKCKSRIVEMGIGEMLVVIWKSWPQNPLRNYDRIQSLTDEQRSELVYYYTGLQSVEKQVLALSATTDALLAGCGALSQAFENTSIRLHRQLHMAHETLATKLTPVQGNLEMSRGRMMPYSYEPDGIRDLTNGTIHFYLRYALVTYLLDKMTTVEESCACFDDSSLPLWHQYFGQQHPVVRTTIPEPEKPRELEKESELPNYSSLFPPLTLTFNSKRRKKPSGYQEHGGRRQEQSEKFIPKPSLSFGPIGPPASVAKGDDSQFAKIAVHWNDSTAPVGITTASTAHQETGAYYSPF